MKTTLQRIPETLLISTRAPYLGIKRTNDIVNKPKTIEIHNAIVVNLGCGLDTRFYRLNNKKIDWLNLDVPNN